MTVNPATKRIILSDDSMRIGTLDWGELSVDITHPERE